MSNWLTSLWNRPVSGSTGASVEEIYSLTHKCNDFMRADIYATYRKILTDTIERTHGIPSDIQKHLWDNCTVSESSFGLITLLVEAMYNKSDLYIVYLKSVDVMRLATPEEKATIKKDYESGKADTSIGAYFSFKHLHTTDMLRLFSELEYCVISGLYKTVNLSKAVQIKISNMRQSVSELDSDIAVEQAEGIADGLRTGRDVLLDAADDITTTTVDVGPIEKSVDFLNSKRAYYLGLPMAYISGIQSGGLNTTGEGDTRAIERGLKTFYYSIIGPALLAIFKVKTTFVSTDFGEMNAALEALKTFELVSDSTLSQEAKQNIIAQMFNLDVEQEKKAKEREALLRGSDTSLNGAQVTAMSQFLDQLATGTLAPESAIQALIVSFNLSREDAEAIVEPMTNFKPRVIK